MYIIQNMDTRKYVARSGSEHSYTKYLQEARTYADRESAKRDCCGNEHPLSIEQAMLMMS